MKVKWSGHDSFATPPHLRQALTEEFGCNFDPCPLNPEFDPTNDVDGLAISWDGKRVFCNPPWSNITPWVEKSFGSKALIIVFILPARTDTEWFHILKDRGAELRLFRKRVHFLKNGDKSLKVSPVDGTLVAVVRPFIQKAAAEWATLP